MFTKEEAAALIKVLEEADYCGLAEFARLDLDEALAAESAYKKLKELV